MENILNEEKLSKFNVGDVQMVPLMTYRTKIMRILGNKIS